MWRAVHVPQQLDVAVKILAIRNLKPRFRRDFEAEVRATARLAHPGIVTVFDQGEVDQELERRSAGRFVAGSPYMVMELVEGGTLLGRPCPDWAQLRGILLQVLDALAHAHARGLIHRDIKPGNVLVIPDGGASPRLKLTDFGIAHFVDQGLRAGDTEELAGTLKYVAPEQILGHWRDYGPWTDLYSLGCVAWRLATGWPPFVVRDPQELLECHLVDEPGRFEPVFEVPPGLEGWLRCCLAKDGFDRFRSAARAARALRRLDGEEPAVPRWRDPDTETPLAMPLVSAGLGLVGLREPTLVGREAEQERLWALLQQVRADGRPRLALLNGSAGVGKSRLARWLGTRAAETGLATVLQATHDPARGPTHGPGPMVGRHLRCLGLDRAATGDRLDRLLSLQRVDDPCERAGLTELLLPATDDDRTQGRDLVHFASATERLALIRRAVERAAADGAAVVWLDDLHHGPESLALLEHVLDQEPDTPRRLLFVATVRDDLLPAASAEARLVRELAEREAVEELAIGPLGQEARTLLIRQLLRLRGSLADEVGRRTGGNPLFAVQLVGDWVQRGVLVAGADGFRLAAGEEAVLPADLSAVWRARLDELLRGSGRAERTALELAAALGQDVDRGEWELLCRKVKVEPAELVARLSGRHLVVESADGWSFVHGMLRETIQGVSDEEGRSERVHLACVMMLRDRYPEGTPGLAERLAHHHLLAGRPDGAIGPAIQAATEALDLSDTASSERLLARALELLESGGVGPDDVRWGDLGLAQSRLRTIQGHFEESVRRVEGAARRARRFGWTRVLPRALRSLGFYALQQGRPDPSMRLYREALPLSEAAGDAEGVARCHVGIGSQLCRVGRWQEGEVELRRAVVQFEAIGCGPGLVDGIDWLAISSRRRGDLDAAERFTRQALQVARRVGYRFGEARVLTSAGEIARQRGQLERSAEFYRASSRIMEALGSQEVVWNRINLGLIELTRGHAEAAEEALVPSLAALERQGRMDMAGAVQVILARCAAQRGAWDRFDRLLARGAERVGRAKFADRDVAVPALKAGDLAREAGERERARVAWRLARAQFRQLEDEEGLAETKQRLEELRG